MTKEQAIAILKKPDRIGFHLIKANDEESNKYNQESTEALNMAIKALEQQPSEEDVQRVVDYLLKPISKSTTSDDCVSRQAVLAIAGDSCLDLDSYEDTKVFCDEIKELPPVIPTHGTCKNCEYMKKDEFGHHCWKCHWSVMDSYKDMMEHFYCADFEKRGDENEIRN